jgi:hypothetical protein
MPVVQYTRDALLGYFIVLGEWYRNMSKREKGRKRVRECRVVFTSGERSLVVSPPEM